MDEQAIDLARVRKPKMGTITLTDDRSTHDCLQIKSRQYHALRTADLGRATDIVFATARELVPTMTEEQAGQLTLEEANAIIAFAGGGIAMVEALFPNVRSPELPTSPG